LIDRRRKSKETGRFWQVSLISSKKDARGVCSELFASGAVSTRKRRKGRLSVRTRGLQRTQSGKEGLVKGLCLRAHCSEKKKRERKKRNGRKVINNKKEGQGAEKGRKGRV